MLIQRFNRFKDSKDFIVHFKRHNKTDIFLQLHIKMPIMKLVIQIQLIRHIKTMVLIIISTTICKINKLSI